MVAAPAPATINPADHFMPIKFAFSTVACPGLTAQAVAATAKEIGFPAVELVTLGSAAGGLASDPAAGDPAAIGAAFADVGVAIACLTSRVALHHHRQAAARAAEVQALTDLDLAARLGCEYLCLSGSEVRPGEDRRQVIERMAQHVRSVIDAAADRGVGLLLENTATLPRAREWWWLLESVDHPMVGLAWNPEVAAAAGEAPSVSIPMLHSRIRMVRIADFAGGDPAAAVLPGDGAVGIAAMVRRLLGIGYSGYASVTWDRLRRPELAGGPQVLKDSYARLRGWTDAAAKAIEDAKPKPKPAKPAAPVVH
jgi:sugar phosphate isomerase/epimerase